MYKNLSKQITFQMDPQWLNIVKLNIMGPNGFLHGYDNVWFWFFRLVRMFDFNIYWLKRKNARHKKPWMIVDGFGTKRSNLRGNIDYVQNTHTLIIDLQP